MQGSYLEFKMYKYVKTFNWSGIMLNINVQFILSHFNYGNGSLFGISDYFVKKMQRVQNFMARVVLNKSWTYRSLEAL